MKKYLLILFLVFNIVLAENVGEFNFRSSLSQYWSSGTCGANINDGFKNDFKIVANSLRINGGIKLWNRVNRLTSNPSGVSYWAVFNKTQNKEIASSTDFTGISFGVGSNNICGINTNYFGFDQGTYWIFNLNNITINQNDVIVVYHIWKDASNNWVRSEFYIPESGKNINDYLYFTGQVSSDFTITYPIQNLDINQYNNTIRYIVDGLAGYNQLFKYDLTLTNKYGTILYSSSTPITTTTLTEGIENTLNVSNHNLKQIIIDNLNNKGYSEFYIYLRLYLTNGSLNINFLGIKYFNLSNVFKPLGDYLSFYNDNIGAFGLSGATPTALFSNLGVLIDNILNINLFTAITPNIQGKDLANSLNNFLAYIKALTNFLPFQLILAFFSIVVLIGLIKKILLR